MSTVEPWHLSWHHLCYGHTWTCIDCQLKSCCAFFLFRPAVYHGFHISPIRSNICQSHWEFWQISSNNRREQTLLYLVYATTCLLSFDMSMPRMMPSGRGSMSRHISLELRSQEMILIASFIHDLFIFYYTWILVSSLFYDQCKECLYLLPSITTKRVFPKNNVLPCRYWHDVLLVRGHGTAEHGKLMTGERESVLRMV